MSNSLQPRKTTAHQVFLSITNCQSLLKLTSIESVMPSNHLILCRPLLLPSVFPSRAEEAVSGHSVLPSREPGVSGAFGGRRKAVRDRFAPQGGTGDFP